MDAIIEFMTPVTVWHWLVIGVALLCIEIAAGTFDLLWIAVAALLTALATSLAPDLAPGWIPQILIFAVAGVALVVLGRTVFAGLRGAIKVHPTLNKRTAALIGQHGAAAVDFVAGEGRIRIGDTTWIARSLSGGGLKAGDAVVVEAADKTVLTVRPL